MIKKLWLMGLMALNVFTLSNVNAQVPSTFESITFNDFNESTLRNDAYTHARDTVYNDLWTFQNFNQAYIEINGIIVVDNGTPISGATFVYQLSNGEYFRLQYQDVTYYFTLNTSVFGENTTETILPNAIYVEGTANDVDYENLVVNLYLPVEGAIAEPEAEGGLLELLVGYGVYNPAGLLMLFAVVVIFTNITLAFLQAPSIVYIIGNLAVGILFASVSFLPIWATFVFISVLVLFFILSIKGVKV